MKAVIDIGREYTEGLFKGEPRYVLSAWLGRNGWHVNAQPSTYGSYAGGGVSHHLSEALVPAIQFLLDHGESSELIISAIFEEERIAVAQALFGWL